MDKNIKNAIGNFFKSVKELQRLGVIRSKNYMENINKVLLEEAYGNSNLKYIAMECPKGAPVRISNTLEYEIIIIILGPTCSLKPNGFESEILFYQFSKEEIVNNVKQVDEFYILGKEIFNNRQIDKIVDLDIG